MRGLLKLFMSGIIAKRTKNTETPKRRLFTQPSPKKLPPRIHLALFSLGPLVPALLSTPTTHKPLHLSRFHLPIITRDSATLQLRPTGGEFMSKQTKNTSKKGKSGPPAIGPREAGLSFLGEEAGPGRRGGRPGRKPAARKTTAPRSRRKLPPGRGAERLCNSVNVILNDESDRIARALVDKTIAGNMSGARLLVELSGVKHPPAKPEDKAEEEFDGPTLAEQLTTTGNWVAWDEWKKNPPLPGESLQAYHDRTVYYLPPPPKPDPDDD
jgi:hypothetical protein